MLQYLSMKKYIKFTLLFLLCGAIVSGCSKSEEDSMGEYNELVYQGEVFYEKHEYSKAIAEFNKAAALSPSSKDAYVFLVQVLVEKGRMDEALSIVTNSANSLSGEDKSELFVLLADSFSEKRLYKQAAELYGKAYDADPSNSSHLLNHAKTLVHLSDFEKASSALDSMEGSNNYEYLMLEAYLAFDDISLATESFKQVEEISIAELSEDEQLNINSFRETLNQAKNEEGLYRSALLSKEYINAGYPTLAVELLNKHEDIDRYWDGLYFLGRAYFDIEDYENSIISLEKAEQLGSLDPDLFYLLAKASFLSGNVNDANQYYKQAFEYSDEDSEALPTMEKDYANFLVANNLGTEAEIFLDSVIDNDWAVVKQIELYYIEGKKEAMKESLGKVSVNDLVGDDKFNYLYWDVIFNLEEGELDNIDSLLDDMESIMVYSPEVQLLRGKFFELKELPDEAKQSYELAIEYDLEGAVTIEAKKLLARIV